MLVFATWNPGRNPANTGGNHEFPATLGAK
jgi:hypothetical protein